MWMFIGVMVLVVMMVVGPVMMIRPTPRQRRLTQLRGTALPAGMSVRMARLKEGVGSHDSYSIAVYSLPVPEELKKTIKDTPRFNWRLLRRNMSHELHLAHYWDWEDRAKAPLEISNSLLDWLTTLPKSVRAVEMTGYGPSLYWTEQALAVELTEGSLDRDGNSSIASEIKYLHNKLTELLNIVVATHRKVEAI